VLRQQEIEVTSWKIEFLIVLLILIFNDKLEGIALPSLKRKEGDYLFFEN
jgi:hypothetical protein